MIISCNYC